MRCGLKECSERSKERGDDDRRGGEGDWVWRMSEVRVPGRATLASRERLTFVVEANAALGRGRRNDGGRRKIGHGRNEG